MVWQEGDEKKMYGPNLRPGVLRKGGEERNGKEGRPPLQAAGFGSGGKRKFLSGSAIASPNMGRRPRGVRE